MQDIKYNQESQNNYNQINKPGFSFIEIMIVVAIIGALMAVLGPRAVGYLGRGKKTAAKAALSAYRVGIDTFHGDTGTFPKDFNDLFTRPSDAKISKLWEAPYITEQQLIQLDPWKKEYQYELTPRGTHEYELYSFGGSLGDGEPEANRISVWDI